MNPTIEEIIQQIDLSTIMDGRTRDAVELLIQRSLQSFTSSTTSSSTSSVSRPGKTNPNSNPKSGEDLNTPLKDRILMDQISDARTKEAIEKLLAYIAE